VRIEETHITPEQARKWLEGSTNRNRNLSRQRVDKLALAISRGQWMLTHQPIALDVWANVIDGQHRLAAIVRADTAVNALVAYEADPETFSVIDTGGIRTPANALQAAGYSSTTTLAAAARLWLAYQAVAGTKRSLEQSGAFVTSVDVLDLLNSPPGALLKGLVPTAGRIASDCGRQGARSWVATGIALVWQADLGQYAAGFTTSLETGAMLEPGDPILALRRFITNAEQASLSARLRCIGALVKAYNSHARGESRKVLMLRADEAMPVVRRP
jgi:hypothetical protein